MSSTNESPKAIEPHRIRFGTKLLLGLVLVSVVVVAVIWALAPPSYPAEALIEVASDQPRARMGSDPWREVPPSQWNRLINSQARLVRSKDVLQETLNRPEVRATSWFTSLASAPKALEALEDDLAVRPVPDTNYISVSLSTKNAEDAAVIVRQVVKQYLDMVQDRARSAFREELKDFRNEEEELSDLITRKLEQIKALEAALPVGTLAKVDVVGEMVLQLTAEVTRLELEVREREGISQLLNDPASPQIVTPQTRLLIEKDPLIARLKDEQLSLELDYRSSLPETPGNKEALERLAKRLKVVEQKLGELRAERLFEAREHEVQTARTAFLNAQHLLLCAKEMLTEAEAAQADQDRKRAKLRTLREELTALKEARARTNDFVREIERAVAAREAPGIRIVQMP